MLAALILTTSTLAAAPPQTELRTPAIQTAGTQTDGSHADRTQGAATPGAGTEGAGTQADSRAVGVADPMRPEGVEADAALPLKDPLGQAVESVGGTIGKALGPTFTHTRWTGWLTLLAGILAGVVAARLIGSAIEAFGERMKPRRELAGLAIAAVARPIGLGLLVLGLAFGLGMLHLSPTLARIAAGTIALLYVVALAWAAINLVDVLETLAHRAIARTDQRAAAMVAPLVGKALRVFVVVVFALFAAENIFQADIKAWLAGLGIAGLAISLASQDSVRNLFGSITVLLDKPFAVGDRIIFDGAEGTVERIGLRSTRIRLLSGNLMTLPNMRFIDGKVENVSARPGVRRLLNVTIPYDTPPEKVEEALSIVRSLLAEPDLAEELLPDRTPVIRFNDLNADSLNLLVVYWYQLRPPDRTWETYQMHAERFNLRLLRRFEDAGIEFAFPTRTLMLAGDPARRLVIEHAPAAGRS